MYDGYRGLIDCDYKFMQADDFSGILTEGGTILGTSRQKYIPGKDIVDDDGNSVMPQMLDTYNRLNLDCLVVMGGNGTQKSAKLLADVILIPFAGGGTAKAACRRAWNFLTHRAVRSCRMAGRHGSAGAGPIY